MASKTSKGAGYSGDERIKQIVKTSAALFSKKGYHDTTTRQIAEACGITSGTLYHYIRAKDDLLAMFADLLTIEFGKFEKNIRRDLPDVSPATALSNTVAGFITLIDDIQDMALFWYQESKNLDSKHLKRMLDMERRIVGLFIEMIEMGRKSGQFKVDDPVIAGFNIKMMCDMWALKRWYFHNLYSLDQFKAKCVAVALSIVHDESTWISR